MTPPLDPNHLSPTGVHIIDTTLTPHEAAKARWTELTAQIDALSDKLYDAWLKHEKPDEAQVGQIQAQAKLLRDERELTNKKIYATDISWTEYYAPSASDNEIED